MRSAGAIFIKQARDVLKNPMILVEFIIFPAVAFVMTQLIAKPSPDISDNMFVSMMAPIFAGMALITLMAGTIAEDIERKSLRFLMMAGVKPHEYLIGTAGFTLLSGTVVSVIFASIGSFTPQEYIKFLAAMIAGVAASTLLGATVGILSKNQQAATALAMPLAVILGFSPMIAQFNAPVRRFASVFYTQQLNVIVTDFSANFPRAMAVIGINIAVFALAFALVYRKRGIAK